MSDPPVTRNILSIGATKR